LNKNSLNLKINKAIISCKKCRLCKTRIKSVPGEGDINAKIMFVGEAPGRNEDEQGRPFVGRAGDLLSRMLNIINLKREEVWIGNVVKCRPPDNRDPMVDELRNCSCYLEQQIKLVDPKIIVPLGRFALEHFDKKGKISKDHGKARVWRNRILYPIYHPAAALRNSQIAAVLADDFRKIPFLLRSGKIGLENVDAGITSNVADNQISLF